MFTVSMHCCETLRFDPLQIDFDVKGDTTTSTADTRSLLKILQPSMLYSEIKSISEMSMNVSVVAITSKFSSVSFLGYEH